MVLLIKSCFLVKHFSKNDSAYQMLLLLLGKPGMLCKSSSSFYVRCLMLISCQYRRSDWWITKNVLLLVVMLCLTIFFSPDEVVIMVPWKHLFEFGNFRVAFFFFYVPVHVVLFSGGLGGCVCLSLREVAFCSLLLKGTRNWWEIRGASQLGSPEKCIKQNKTVFPVPRVALHFVTTSSLS